MLKKKEILGLKQSKRTRIYDGLVGTSNRSSWRPTRRFKF
jgi:hypothetical protein